MAIGGSFIYLTSLSQLLFSLLSSELRASDICEVLTITKEPNLKSADYSHGDKNLGSDLHDPYFKRNLLYKTSSTLEHVHGNMLTQVFEERVRELYVQL